jgi:hypothetical protein
MREGVAFTRNWSAPSKKEIENKFKIKISVVNILVSCDYIKIF